ncbi:MAG: tetratricopeptide repeat protein [Polyangiaceae bacterium]|nr:tetratricopeptide repeat protein [Polyangiaceae bacterium]
MSTAAHLLHGADDRFFARREPLREVSRALLEGQSVVLVGPPGVGKTRLAAECLRTLADETTLVVKLGDVKNAQGLVSRVAMAAGVFRSPAATGAESQARLLRALSSRGPTIVVLDGFEHLPAEADELLRGWMKGSPLAFLVTSRRTVDCDARHVELGPLDTLERRGEWSEAATLLRARASEITKVVLDDGDRDALHALARRLDGLPLALELAAARLSVLTPAQLLARLDKRFQTLDGEGRGLAAALETSYALLEEPARAVLRACSVFRGGIRLEALELVVGEERDTLGPLSALRAHSLITVERVGDRYRYSLSHSVRDFVERREESDPAWDTARARHARYWACAGAAEAEEPAGLLLEIENLRAALAWARGREPELAGQLSLVLSSPALGLPYGEACSVVSAALAEQPLSARLQAELLFRRGTVRRFVADFPGAIEDLERAHPLAERLGDAALTADILAGLGNGLSGQADWPGARRYLERALASSSSPTFQASALAMIANTYSNEDAYDRAEPLLRRSIALAEEHHDAFAEAFARLSLGILLVERGAFDEAFSALIDSLSIFETSRSARVMQARHLRAVALTHLARVKQETGDTAGALTDYHEAVAYAEETGVRRAEAFALYGLGSLLLELGELRAADDRIRAALPLMRESCRDVEGALVALQGVLFALRGARADAERFFRRAEALLAAHQRPVFEAALKVLRGADPGETPFAEFADVRLALRLRALFAETRDSPPLFVAHDASFFRAPDSAEQVSLARRKALRAILRTLVEARLARPGVPLSVEALVAAGWPGEKVLAAAGAERVYAAIATLRRLGLRGFLEQQGAGYLLRADRPVVTHDPRP